MRKIQKIKLLFRIRSLEMGGVQKVLFTILKLIDKEKFDLTLLVNLEQGELRNKIPEGIKVVFLAKGKEEFSKNKLIHTIQKGFRLMKLKAYNEHPKIINEKLKEKYDIDVAFSYDMFYIVNKTTALSKHKIGWHHGDLRNFDFSEEKKIQLIEEFKKFDKVVYVSNQTKEVIDDLNGTPLNNSLVIHNPIETEEIIRKSNEPIDEVLSSTKTDGIPSFLFVGRITRGKGINLLYEAHRNLINEGVKHKVYLIGEGEEFKNQIKELDKENKFLEHSFIFLGGKKNPYPYYKNTDFFVLPSLSEAYPLVIPEALILGKAVITTEVGGVREMMNNEVNGLIVPINSNDIYLAMKRFLQDDEFMAKVLKNNLECKEFFSAQKRIEEIEKLFISLTDDNA